MSKESTSSGGILRAASIIVAFAATMIAMWSFTQARLGWGGYNLAIALIALAVIVALRAREDEA